MEYYLNRGWLFWLVQIEIVPRLILLEKIPRNTCKSQINHETTIGYDHDASVSFPSGPCKHITWLKARVAMPWPSCCIGNEAGVAEFQPIEREFLRARTTSSRAFHARYTRRLGIPATEFLKPRSQRTNLAAVCTDGVTVTSRSFVRWPEQKKIYTRAGGSVDFVREIVFPCPKETFSRPAVIRYATTIPVVLSSRSRFYIENRRIFPVLWTPVHKIYTRWPPMHRCKIYTFDVEFV